MAHEISFTLFITNTIQNIITRFLRNNNGFSMFGKRPGINAKSMLNSLVVFASEKH